MSSATAADLAAEASDPATPPARLAELAGDVPWLRPLVAEHPALYPGLRDWLADLHDPAVDAALARAAARASAAAPAPPPAPPAPTDTIPAAPLAAAPTTPAPAPAGPAAETDGPAADDAASHVRRRRRALPIVLVAAGVVVVLAIGAVAWVLLRPASSSALASATIGDLAKTPTALPWSVSPSALKGTASLVGRVDAHRSLFAVTDGSSSHLALLDSSTRSIVWSVSSPAVSRLANADVPNVLLAVDPIVVQTESRILALDPATGRTVGRSAANTSSLGTIFGSAGAVDLHGDLIANAGGTIERLAPTALGTPKWRVKPASSSSTPVTVGDRLVLGAKAWSLDDGSSVSWKGVAGDQDYAIGTHLIAQRRGLDGNGTTWVVLDPSSGATLGSPVSFDSSAIATVSDSLLVYADSSRLHALDLATGQERWAVDGTVTADTPRIAIPSSLGLVALPTTGTRQYVNVADASTGASRYRLEVAANANADFEAVLVGTGSHTMYLTSQSDIGSGVELHAVDTASGADRWTVSRENATYTTVGDQLVAIDSSGTIVSLIE